MAEIKEAIKSTRYHELDSLRGLAALSVFFSHFLGILFINDPYKNILTNSVFHIFWDGAAAVVLFFVLSGFVLALPYVKNNDKKFDIPSFYIRRVFRIYPAYIAALVISILLKMFLYNREGIESFNILATMFWNWDASALTIPVIVKHVLMVGPKFEMGLIDPIIWSLVVEMKMSIIFPLFIPIFKRLKSIWWGFFLVIGSIFFYKGLTHINIPILTYFIDDISYIPYFLLGGCLAKFHKQMVSSVVNFHNITKILIGLCAIMLYTSRFSIPRLPLNYTDTGYLVSSGVVLILILALSIPHFSNLLKLKPVLFLGDISYSFYLLHFPILLTFTSLLFYHFSSIKASLIVSLLLSVIMSYISYIFIEKVFMNVGKNLALKYSNTYSKIKNTSDKKSASALS